jgi:Transglycosylase SLT domain
VKRWLIESKYLVALDSSETTRNEDPSAFEKVSFVAVALVLGLAMKQLFSCEEDSEKDPLDESAPTATPLPSDKPPAVETPKFKFPDFLSSFKKLFSFTPPPAPSPPVISATDSPTTTDKSIPAVRAKIDPYSDVPESVFKLGSFTKEESDKVKDLYRTKSNVKATGGISPELVKYITERAPSYGLKATNVLKVVSMESGGNPNAVSSTGALGAFQLTGATASSLGVRNRFDPFESADGAMRLMQENSKLASKKGLEPDLLSNYLVYQLGPSAAVEVLRAKPSTKIDSLSPKTVNAVRLNYGGKSSTVGEYLTKNNAKLDKPPSLQETATAVSSTAPRPTSINVKPEPDVSAAAKPAQALILTSSTVGDLYMPSSLKNQVASDSSTTPLPQSIVTGPNGLLIST